MKALDVDALMPLAGDQETRDQLHKIAGWRRYTMEHNAFIDDDTAFSLRLAGLDLHLVANSAFSSIEVFQEIFLKDNHFLSPEFIPRDGQTILDLGANQGYYLLRARTFAPACRALAFEPNPLMFDALTKNLGRNGAGDIPCVAAAIAGQDGEIDLEIVPQIGAIGGRNLRIPARAWLKEEFIRTVRVRGLALDTVFATWRLDRVDILKIDVEGMEGEILRNFHAFDRVERIVVEFHSGEGRQELTSLLQHHGFTLRLTDHEEGDYYGDLYFVRKS